MNTTEKQKLHAWALDYYEYMRKQYLAGVAPMFLTMTAWSFARDAGASVYELGKIDKLVAKSPGVRNNPTMMPVDGRCRHMLPRSRKRSS